MPRRGGGVHSEETVQGCTPEERIPPPRPRQFFVKPVGSPSYKNHNFTLPFCPKTLYTPRPRMILLKTTQNRAFYLIVLQSGVVVAIVVALLFCGYTKSAVSACAGGAIVVLTNACFAFLFLSRSYLPTAHQVLARLYFAEIVKWILTISLFYLMIIKMEVVALPFFLSYAVAQWIGLLGFLL